MKENFLTLSKWTLMILRMYKKKQDSLENMTMQ